MVELLLQLLLDLGQLLDTQRVDADYCIGYGLVSARACAFPASQGPGDQLTLLFSATAAALARHGAHWT